MTTGERRILQALLSILLNGEAHVVGLHNVRYVFWPPGGINKDGYRIYKLTLPSGEKRTFRVHRLVCEAWHGRPPTEKHQVAHWDGNKANNHFGNLRWATPQENSHDCVRQGIDPVGVRNGRAKSSEADVREIRTTYKGGYRNLKSFARNMAFQAKV